MIAVKYILSCLLIILFSFNIYAQKKALPKVFTISEMKKVKLQGDLTQHVSWDTLDKKYMYAVAPLGRLEGEVTVLNSKMYCSIVKNDNEISINNEWSITSPFAVYTYVKDWESYSLGSIKDEYHLQLLIENIAVANGYDTSQPFVFLIKGDFKSIDYHIISKPIDETEHNAQLHNKAKKNYTIYQVSGQLLGFYSKKHEGVFTHKGHYIHTHFIDNAKKAMGHLDNVETIKSTTIYLPKL